MLGSAWLIVTVLLFIISLILHQVPLLLAALLFFLAGAVARLWDRYCLSRVEFHRYLSADRVFFGEEVLLEIDIANRKPLPLPWLQADDEIPEELTLLKGRTSPSYKTGRVVLNNLLSLGWYHRVKRRYRLECRHRGFFAFGPARLRSGDLFGFFSREQEAEGIQYLMVYPKMVPLEKLGIPSKQPLGDIRTRHHIFQDPMLTSGVRDYHAGDSLKHIHWKSTARLGKLQTKVFEPTTTVDMGIFLDVRTVPPPDWGFVPELLELAIITAASLAKQALDDGYRVGLYVNQNRWSARGLVRLPPSRHRDQLPQMLEALAQVHPSEVMPVARLLASESRNLSWGSTMVVISATPTEALLAALTRLQMAGRRVALISVGGAAPPAGMEGLAVYHVPADVPWQEMETLGVAGGRR